MLEQKIDKISTGKKLERKVKQLINDYWIYATALGTGALLSGAGKIIGGEAKVWLPLSIPLMSLLTVNANVDEAETMGYLLYGAGAVLPYSSEIYHHAKPLMEQIIQYIT